MYLIIRFALWIAGFLLCTVFRVHSYRPQAVRFARIVEWDPQMTRIVIRYTDRKCRLCGKRHTLTERARVARDWQEPARLFSKVRIEE